MRVIVSSILATTLLGGVAFGLSVESNFEGASVSDLKIDEGQRSVSFAPGGDPERGWPCWWYFKITDVKPGETITLRLHGSPALMPRESPPKPLAGVWAKPDRATFSTDGKTWSHTDLGTSEGSETSYQIKVDGSSVFVAWGPPFTPKDSAELVRELSARSPAAKVEELCKSRGGRPVPMLRVMEGALPQAKRFGIWVEARQHAWESGSSWVARGFGEWVVSDDADAAWLRQHAEIVLIPIMDIDNTAAGNGGKDELPQDHNRDWSDAPHWNEVVTAQQRIREWIAQGRMDIFLDLHNPGAGDKKAFFYALPDDLVKQPMLTMRDRFISMATERISTVFPMLDKPKNDGPKYHPLWRQMSGTWVSFNGNPKTVGTCLETSWNTPTSTTTGYRAVGAHLAKAVHDFLATRDAPATK